MSDRKILVVDDEEAFCKSLKMFLGKRGYEVLTAFNGEDAIRQMREAKPDLMTLDIRMPGVNGYEVLEKAREMNEKTIIIVVSAIDIPDMEESFKKAGAQAVIYKPVNLVKLLETIQKLLPA